MARTARLEIAAGWYHVINRGHQRRAIFREPSDYQNFRQRLSEFPLRFGIKVHTYVLMPNHYHLLLELGSQPALGAAMHWLNTGYGIWFNRRRHRSGALFQGRYKAILLDPDECLLAVHYYIHLNPVRVGALKRAEGPNASTDPTLLQRRRTALREHAWSSYPDYAGLRRPEKWLSLAAVRERTGLSVQAYRRELDRRVTADRLELDWSGELVAGVLMGSSVAVAGWKRLLGTRAGSETRRFGLVSWEEITSAISAEWAQPWEQLMRARGTGAVAWAIWFGRHRGGLTLEQLRQKLGRRSYAAVAMQVARLQRALVTETRLQTLQKKLARRLNVEC